MSRARTATPCVVVALSLTALTANASPASQPTCGDREIRGLVRAFIRAFNRGEWERVDRMWSRRDFKWYTAAQAEPRVVHQVFERKNLISYFKVRHRRGERFGLAWFRLNDPHGYADFEYSLYRRANDLREGATVLYGGKGAASCVTAPRLVVWSMGSRG